MVGVLVAMLARRRTRPVKEGRRIGESILQKESVVACELGHTALLEMSGWNCDFKSLPLGTDYNNAA